MKFTRRKLIGAAVGSVAVVHNSPAQERSANASPKPFPTVTGVTRETAEFITNLQYSAIPPDVIELGKKSILDGLGLALCGSMAETGSISRNYVNSLGLSRGEATVAGSSMSVSPRF